MTSPQSQTLNPSSRETPRPEPTAPWLGEALTLIDSLSRYDENWDSNHAAAVTTDAVLGAKRWATRLASRSDLARPLIYPTRGGGVQFEWEAGQRYLEIEVESSSSAKWYGCDRDAGAESEGRLREDDNLAELCARIQAVLG
jgi:hypothetical protein